MRYFIETEDNKIYEVEKWRLNYAYSYFKKLDFHTYAKLCVEKPELDMLDILFADNKGNIFISTKAILLWYEE